MRIHPNLPVQQVMNKYTQAVQKTEKSGAAKFVSDKIEISDAAREVQMANQAFKNLPEVREELVQSLKQAIQQGTYKPSSEAIAKKMIGHYE